MPSNTNISGLRCPQEACNTIVFGVDSKRLMKHHNQPQYHGHRFPQGPRGYQGGQGFSGFSSYDSRLKFEGYIACQECPYDSCTTIIMGNDWRMLMKFHTDSKHGIPFEETNLGRMPLEILLKILWYIMPEDFRRQQRNIPRLASVCKRLNEVTKCPELYREICLSNYTRAVSLPFFKKMIRDYGSQLRKFTCGGENGRLLLPTLKKCGDTIQEVHVSGKITKNGTSQTPVGIAVWLAKISKLNPKALRHLQFNEITHAMEGELAFTLEQRKSDQDFSSRIVGLKIDFDGIYDEADDEAADKKWEAKRFNTAKLVALAICGIPTLQKVTVIFCTLLDISEQLMVFEDVSEQLNVFKDFIVEQDSLSLRQISYSELRKVTVYRGLDLSGYPMYYKCWECDITWKSNGVLTVKTPSETFNMFLQGLREIKKVNQ